jgi:hypothetical protein
MLKAPLGAGYPVASIPRRIVAHMLLMATFKLGDPVKAFIQVVIYNFSWRSCVLQLQGFHVIALCDRLCSVRATNNPRVREAHV